MLLLEIFFCAMVGFVHAPVEMKKREEIQTKGHQHRRGPVLVRKNQEVLSTIENVKESNFLFCLMHLLVENEIDIPTVEDAIARL